MIYRDNLYGEWELPEIVEKLIQTNEMIRLRNIAQAVLPNNISPQGSIPNRFQHGMGVARLAEIVGKSFEDSHIQNLLMASALLHDAGNPPFSHMSEPFLEELTGHNGESFLKEILFVSETSRVLRQYGLDDNMVVSMVTGKTEFSEILNGSLDIDNLDNIARYYQAVFFERPDFDGQEITRRFVFKEDGKKNRWCLKEEALSPKWGLHNWIKMRGIVYETVYSSHNLSPAMMVFRALDIAFRHNLIDKRFFYRDDISAVEFLAGCCGPEPGILMNQVLRWQWYSETYCYESVEQIDVDNHWASRSNLADYLCDELKVPQNAICVYMGKGRDVKSITLPIIKDNGQLVEYNPIEGKPIYRVEVFVRPDLLEYRQCIPELTREKLSIS